jgi:dihydrodipicolinate synthase/N-acetylneuraminate lyase
MEISGCGAANVTTFRTDGSFDKAALQALVD